MATEQDFDAAAAADDTLAGMSDEQIAELDPSTFFQSSEGADDGASTEGEEEADDQSASEADDGGVDDADAGDESGADDASAADDDADGTDADDADEPEGESAEGEEPAGDDDPEADDPEGEEGADDKSDKVDYKAAYEQIMAPFKANGKEIKIDSVEDAVSLMQMGANYNKKMAALKPNLKALKLLENNNLLGDEQLNYLVDLSNKNPDAIKKLIKDSGIDPLEIDTEKDSDYTPSDHSVDDREIELDSVLDEIQETPTYQKTIQLVKDQWDAESKREVSQSPQVLKIINDHMQSGVYDVINSELEKERMLGRLNGLSDIQAYKQVGDAIQARGGFDHLHGEMQSRQSATSEAQPEPRKVAAKPAKKASDPQVKSKKRAASSTRTAPAASKADVQNPLAMSDAEFDRLVNENLL